MQNSVSAKGHPAKSSSVIYIKIKCYSRILQMNSVFSWKNFIRTSRQVFPFIPKQSVISQRSQQLEKNTRDWKHSEPFCLYVCECVGALNGEYLVGAFGSSYPPILLPENKKVEVQM